MELVTELVNSGLIFNYNHFFWVYNKGVCIFFSVVIVIVPAFLYIFANEMHLHKSLSLGSQNNVLCIKNKIYGLLRLQLFTAKIYK